MVTEKQINFLQAAYAGALVDAMSNYTREGIVEKVAAQKEQTRTATTAAVMKSLDISTPEEVFCKLSETFGCAAWQINEAREGFVAETRTCMMAALAKRTGAPAPCALFCLDPMEAMVKALAPQAVCVCTGTLFTGDACRVAVRI